MWLIAVYIPCISNENLGMYKNTAPAFTALWSLISKVIKGVNQSNKQHDKTGAESFKDLVQSYIADIQVHARFRVHGGTLSILPPWFSCLVHLFRPSGNYACAFMDLHACMYIHACMYKQLECDTNAACLQTICMNECVDNLMKTKVVRRDVVLAWKFFHRQRYTDLYTCNRRT